MRDPANSLKEFFYHRPSETVHLLHDRLFLTVTYQGTDKIFKLENNGTFTPIETVPEKAKIEWYWIDYVNREAIEQVYKFLDGYKTYNCLTNLGD